MTEYNYIEQIRSIISAHHTQYGKFLKKPENKHLLDYIMSYENEKLKNNNMQTHLYWLLNNIHEFPICDAPDCNNPITKNVANIFTGYDRTACSCKCAKKTSHYKEAYKKTINETYGCDHPMKCQEIKDKVRETTTERWGGIGFASDELRQKTEDKCMELYGVKNGGGSEQALKKIVETTRERFGVDNAMQCEEIKKKVFTKQLEIYGGYWGGKLPNKVSKGEKEVLEYVKSIYHGTIIENDRTQMEPNAENNWLENHELDIWLPDIKVAIEFNGTYWHALPNIVESDYFKRLQCESKGIKLLSISEEDWSIDNHMCRKRICDMVNTSCHEDNHNRQTA